MSRSARRQRQEAQLRSLEEQFPNNLVAALRQCAAGKWGMFVQNDTVIATEGKNLRERLKSTVSDELLEAGKEIERLRRELGDTDPLHPFRRYLEYRKRRSGNSPGEPKLAMQFLEELGLE
jgi:hypothetical protein